MHVEPLESRYHLATYSPPASTRAEVDLSSSWKFIRSNKSGAEAIGYNDAGWSNVSLPHTWNAKDGQDGNIDYYRGVGWYRKTFTISSTYTGKQFYLRFGAAMLQADIFVNGSLIGSHKGGYSAFIFDLNPWVKVGKTTTLAVKVSNAEDKNVAPYYDPDNFAPDWTKFGGLYRDVKMLVTDPIQISPLNAASPGIFVKQSNVSSSKADVQISTEVRNSGGSTKTVTVNSTIVDASNNIIKTLATGNVKIAARKSVGVVQSTSISNPRLWNGTKDPYRYRVYTTISAGSGTNDVLSQSFGLRYYKVDANQGFLLNGKKYDLRGTAFHQDRLDKGYAISSTDRQQDLNLLTEMGANALRTAHYQMSDDVYEFCDKKGIIVWSSVPLDGVYNNTTQFTDNLQNQLKETIRQLYNRPSIFFWGVGNEMNDTDGDRAMVSMLHTLAKKEDPTRLTMTANNLENDASVLKFASDVDGFNKYFGWYGTQPTSAIGTWLDALHKKYPTVPVMLSEFGAGGSAFQHTDNPVKPVPTRQPNHPEEYQAAFHEVYLAAVKARPWLVGAWPWSLIDFASDWRGEGDQIGRNDKGFVTYDRKTKKDVFYLYKANWSSSATMYITDRRFTERTVATTNVKVYSNCDSVTLSVNGKTIGTVTPDGIEMALFKNVTLSPGANVISVTGKRGGKTYTDTCTWTLNAARPASSLFSAQKPIDSEWDNVSLG